METVPQFLKVRIASFLPPSDVVRLSWASTTLHEELALARIPMRIPFKSWYDEPLDSDKTIAKSIKRGPKVRIAFVAEPIKLSNGAATYDIIYI